MYLIFQVYKTEKRVVTQPMMCNDDHHGVCERLISMHSNSSMYTAQIIYTLKIMLKWADYAVHA